MIKRILLIIIFLTSINIYSQLSDCAGAIAVCETSTQDHNVNGLGVDDFPGLSGSGCLGTGSGSVTTVEANSIWFRFRASGTGEMGFNIIPFDMGEDWDFALYGPDDTCGNLSDPMRGVDGNFVCNYSTSGGNGNTGAGVDPVSGVQNIRYSSYFLVETGKEYLLLINSFAGSNNQFTLEWTGDLIDSSPGTNPLDCSIVVGDLGADQDVCEGTTVTLDATPSMGTAVGYKWFVDTGAGFMELVGETNPTLVIDDDVSGIYKAEVTDMDGNTGEDEVVITFHPQATIGTLPFTTYEQCEVDGFSFDLPTLFDSDLLDGQDPAIFEVAYYNTLADANANLSPIIGLYTSPTPFVSVEIFARVLNTAAPNACMPVTTSFNLLVNPNPVLQNPADYEFCDDNTDGDDTNGIVQNFILSTKDTEVLGPSLDPADYTVNYYESLDDANNDLSPIDKINPYTNITAVTQPIFVRVTNNATGCFTFSSVALFNLVVNPLPVVNSPVLLQLCDTDQDGFISFDLTEANPDISADFVNEIFIFYPTLLDAQNDTNAISAPDAIAFTNINDTNDSVWVRTFTVNGCFRISQINLEVTNTVIPTTFERTFNVCDDYLDINGVDNINNDDTDGVTTFDFSATTAEIIAEFPPSQTFNITYYQTLSDANSAINEITDISNYRNISSPNTQQIFIRVENPANATCLYVGTHITLVVDPVPTAQPASFLELCDDNSDGDDTNGFVQSFNLESQNATILGAQDPADFTVTYHESAADANSGANPLSSPYSNTIANTQTIYVRVTNNTTGCFTDRTNFDIFIRPLPVITDAVELRQCDTDTDGFSDFNLNEAATDISDNFINETFVFYPTLLDAQNDTNAISDADAIVFTNRTVTTDIVWARAISTFGCYRISEVTLIVSTTGIPATFQRNFENCDDFLDINGDDNIDNDDTDGVATFDFSGVDIQIRNLFPPTQALTITYYRNQADALAELNAITDTANYRNIGYPNSQQIYVRVDSDLDNDCLGFGPHITLTVDPVPTATDVSDLELCDNLDDGDGFNGIVQTFDLESQTPLILGTQNPADYTVTYHTNAADANAGVAAITTSGMYTNTVADLQTIYVRVTNNTTLCFTDHTSFDLIVNPLPVANFVQDLEICDDDSDGSAQNGFSQSFDLELQTPGVLGTQDPAIFSVTYHASLADAQAGILPLGSPFSNSVPFSQIIYVRVFNSATQCANGISNFNAIVNPEPTTENVSNLSYCDDATDGDDTNGFIQNIDLDSQILGILGPLQDEDDFTVTFHETAADASSGNSPLSSPYSNTVAGQQTIYVRVLNDDTLCVNDDFTFDVIVNPLPDFQVTTPQIVCLNGPPLTIRVENPAAVYDYVWTDPNGNMIAGVSEITITSGGLYTITASTTDGTTDENGVSCARVRTIQVDESIIATITDDDVIIVDDNDNNSITIDPTNLGIGDYEYALINEDNGQTTPFQDDPLFENLEGGFYTILVRDKNGCGTASLLVSVVVFPKFFTPNNDGVNDTWAIKGANSTFFPSSQIHIFNRFGKVIAEIDIDNPGWNGTFNGKALPSDDYWFSIILVPANTNRPPINRKGNFAMLRNQRN